MLTGSMIDYIEFGYDFSIARTQLIVSGPTHQVEKFRSLQCRSRSA